MNYWPAETCNLSECHQPLFDLIQQVSTTGRKTAEVNYGAKGWVSHHNIDLWRQSAPVGNYGGGAPTWANWQMSGSLALRAISGNITCSVRTRISCVRAHTR